MTDKKKMYEFTVTIPITGVAHVVVEAEDEEDAIRQGFEVVTLDDVDDWSSHRRIIEGNVFYGTQNEAEATNEGEVPE